MKAKITDTCICCGSCAAICPVAAIDMAASGDKYEVNPEKCIACTACVNACPVEAIIMTDDAEKNGGR